MALDVKRVQNVIIMSAVSFGISLMILISGIMDGFEFKAYDAFSKYLNPSEEFSDIVIVQIDQQSIDSLSTEGVNWPWPRQMYAPMIDYMSEADAVFMDILFTEPSSYGEQDDLILSEALTKASNVYLPVFLTDNERHMEEADIQFLKKIHIKEEITAGMSYNYAITPTDSLKTSVSGSGNVTIPPDKDGVYRSVPLIFQSGGFTIPHFVLDYFLNEGLVTIKNGSLYAGDTEVPFNKEQLNLRYSANKEPFIKIAASEVLRSYLDSKASGTPVYSREFFRGKKIFIGLTAAGLYDLKPTAVSSISTGVQIHATTFENIINRNFIRSISSFYVISLMLIICAFMSFFVLRFHSLHASLLIFLLSLCFTILIPAILFRNALYMNIIFPSLSMITAFIVSAAYSYATEGRERRFVKKTFSQYMDRNIVEYILKNPELIKPGGQRKRVTVFFADIAGFTTLAEKISAEETAKVLHTVLNSLTEIIIKNRGVIDKYIGDCIMAFWGAPLDTERDEINACYAALQCIESLDEMNRRLRADGLPDISFRIGVHSGSVIAGNLGSDRLFDYTIIGDTVNLTSRLESANKHFGTKIIVSKETLQKTDDLFFARDLGMIAVKGKNTAVRIYELMAENSKVSADQKEIAELFKHGLTLFSDRKWQAALEVFDRMLNKFAADGPSEFYGRRCENYISNPELTREGETIKLEDK